MLRNTIIVLMVLASFAVALNAQDRQRKTLNDRNAKNLQENVDSLQVLVDSLKDVIIMKDSICTANHSAMAALEEDMNNDLLQMAAIVDSLQGKIVEQNAEIAYFQRYAGFLDTCMVKLANRWLYERFDKEAVDEAISYFDWIYSDRTKSDLSIVQRLLKDYEKSYKEFQSILRAAQDDVERESPFAIDGYRKRYLDRLADMEYYRQYYNSDWSIRYLDRQIDDAMEILENHSDTKPADFGPLIDTNINF